MEAEGNEEEDDDIHPPKRIRTLNMVLDDEEAEIA